MDIIETKVETKQVFLRCVNCGISEYVTIPVEYNPEDVEHLCLKCSEEK